MPKRNKINLSYFEENGLDSKEFLKDILQTSLNEIYETLMNLSQLASSGHFDENNTYEVIHKFKPTAQIYQMETFHHYEKFGSANKKLDEMTFQKIFPELKEDLLEAAKEIKNELKSIEMR